MLVSQRPVSGPASGHGCLGAALAELQRQGARSVHGKEGLRQRLLELARRLARVQSLGNECARVAFSEYARDALREADAEV
jgi:hypothetical protein